MVDDCFIGALACNISKFLPKWGQSRGSRHSKIRGNC